MKSHPTTPPSTALKTLSACVRLMWWAVLGCWLLFAVAGAFLHFWIVPRIGDYREWVAQQASQALGTKVQVGNIQAFSSGVLPSFLISDVVLHDAADRPTLRLGTVQATLSPRSLFSLNFEQLVISQPELDIRRDKNGTIWVAGIDFSHNKSSDTSALDWFFSQHNFQIHGGTVRWVDEQLLAVNESPEPLALTDVNLVNRNPLHRHLLQLQATPPAGWGQKITLVGELTQSLIHTDRGQFDQWNGDLYLDMPQLDVTQLRRYVKLDAQIKAGSGAARAWMSIKKGQPVDTRVDVALNQVDLQLNGASQALALQFLQGQITGRQLTNGYEVQTKGLAFATTSGLVWPGGNFFFSHQPATEKKPEWHSLKADQVDLAVLGQLAGSLPIAAPMGDYLRSLAPQGLIQTLDANWQGPSAKPLAFQAKGVVNNVHLAAQNANATQEAGRPGIHGATVEFDLSRDAGKANVKIDKGWVSFPGVWEDPTLPITQLNADLTWRITPDPQGEKIQVQLANGVIKSPDADGQFTASWQTSDPGKVTTRSRFPGILDLKGQLTRADGAKVWRYLPLVVPQSARDYVRMAVREGQATDTRFVVQGDLNHMPFADPKLGRFLIEAKVDKAVLAYVPVALQSPGEAPWPEFSQLNGELIFDGPSMEVRNAKASITGLPGLKISKANVKISDLENPVVKVQAQAQGLLNDMLRFVNQSPLKSMTSGALLKAKAVGSSDYTLAMTLPVDDLNKSQVEGTVKLAGNDVQLSPDTPLLKRSTGNVIFNENGFQVLAGKATMLGGEVEFEGGTNALNPNGKLRTGSDAPKTGDPDITIRGKGLATAVGLQQAQELGFVPRFAKFVSGSAAYGAVLTLRHEHPELVVTSNLQGMALHLPAPFNKPAETTMGFLYENLLVPASLKTGPLQDTLKVELGRQVAAQYVRNLSGPEPRVIKGELAIGLAAGEHAPQPASGVGANVLLPTIDVDTWSRVLDAVGGPAGSATAAGSNNDYLPKVMAVRASQLVWSGRTFQNVVAGITRDNNIWRANVDAVQLAGYLEYRSSATDPRLYARLSRANLGAAQQAEVEQVLSDPKGVVPALDLDIDNLELAGRSLGRVQVEAINRVSIAGRNEWKLNRLLITKDFAKLTASGTWGNTATIPLASVAVPTSNRRMLLNFRLDVEDAGELLNWYGKEKTVRKGKGRLEGTLAWQGSPFAVHYPSMAGQIQLALQSGQFLKVDPGAAKLLSVLSLQSLPRRLTLDFRDVFSEGFAFDTIQGDINLDQGIATTKNLQMAGLNALVLMEGSADVVKETQNLRVLVVPEISATGVSLAYAAINPAIGIGSLIAQWLLAGPLTEAATREYLIEGSWAEPTVKEVKHKPQEKPFEKPAAKVADKVPLSPAKTN